MGPLQGREGRQVSRNTTVFTRLSAFLAPLTCLLRELEAHVPHLEASVRKAVHVQLGIRREVNHEGVSVKVDDEVGKGGPSPGLAEPHRHRVLRRAAAGHAAPRRECQACRRGTREQVLVDNEDTSSPAVWG